MASFNKVILMGNLTRDPDVRATGASGMKVARLGLAVNERRRDRSGQVQEFPVFVDVDAWDKLAELCGQYLSKGRSVLVEGRLQMDSWAASLPPHHNELAERLSSSVKTQLLDFHRVWSPAYCFSDGKVGRSRGAVGVRAGLRSPGRLASGPSILDFELGLFRGPSS